jgi:hypothetical protein
MLTTKIKQIAYQIHIQGLSDDFFQIIDELLALMKTFGKQL